MGLPIRRQNGNLLGSAHFLSTSFGPWKTADLDAMSLAENSLCKLRLEKPSGGFIVMVPELIGFPFIPSSAITECRSWATGTTPNPGRNDSFDRAVESPRALKMQCGLIPWHPRYPALCSFQSDGTVCPSAHQQNCVFLCGPSSYQPKWKRHMPHQLRLY